VAAKELAAVEVAVEVEVAAPAGMVLGLATEATDWEVAVGMEAGAEAQEEQMVRGGLMAAGADWGKEAMGVLWVELGVVVGQVVPRFLLRLWLF